MRVVESARSYGVYERLEDCDGEYGDAVQKKEHHGREMNCMLRRIRSVVSNANEKGVTLTGYTRKRIVNGSI